jgi:hypothetical protein
MIFTRSYQFAQRGGGREGTLRVAALIVPSFCSGRRAKTSRAKPLVCRMQHVSLRMHGQSAATIIRHPFWGIIDCHWVWCARACIHSARADWVHSTGCDQTRCAPHLLSPLPDARTRTLAHWWSALRAATSLPTPYPSCTPPTPCTTHCRTFCDCLPKMCSGSGSSASSRWVVALVSLSAPPRPRFVSPAA